MQAIVVGCGRVGRELAMGLESEGHSVTVIDREESAFHRLPEAFKGRTVRGIGFDRSDLEVAGIRTADALAAVTSGDNTNIVAARIAKETYGVQTVVARIYDPRRAVVYQRVGIPTVATVAWATDQILRVMLPDTRAAEWTDVSGEVHLLEFELPDPWAGQRLLPMERPPLWRLVALTRAGQTTLIDADTVGQDGDVIHVAVTREAREGFKASLREGGAQ